MIGIQVLWVVIFLVVSRLFFYASCQGRHRQWRLDNVFKTLARYGRLYVLLEAQYIKARMNYRVDFIVSSIGMIFSNIASLLVFWVLFRTIPRLAGWTFEEILFIYGFYLLAVSPAQIFFDHILPTLSPSGSWRFIPPSFCFVPRMLRGWCMYRQSWALSFLCWPIKYGPGA